MTLKTLLKTVLNRVSKLAYPTLMTAYLVRIHGQFITVTGIPSSGKSDFVDQMVLAIIKTMAGKQHLHHLKILQTIYMRIS